MEKLHFAPSSGERRTQLPNESNDKNLKSDNPSTGNCLFDNIEFQTKYERATKSVHISLTVPEKSKNIITNIRQSHTLPFHELPLFNLLL